MSLITLCTVIFRCKMINRRMATQVTIAKMAQYSFKLIDKKSSKLYLSNALGIKRVEKATYYKNSSHLPIFFSGFGQNGALMQATTGHQLVKMTTFTYDVITWTLLTPYDWNICHINLRTCPHMMPKTRWWYIGPFLSYSNYLSGNRKKTGCRFAKYQMNCKVQCPIGSV